jgi:hypothetical protein
MVEFQILIKRPEGVATMARIKVEAAFLAAVAAIIFHFFR